MGRNDTKRLKNICFKSVWKSDDNSIKPVAEYITSLTLLKKTASIYEVIQTSTLITGKSIHSDNVTWLVTDNPEDAWDMYRKISKGKFNHDIIEEK